MFQGLSYKKQLSDKLASFSMGYFIEYAYPYFLIRLELERG